MDQMDQHIRNLDQRVRRLTQVVYGLPIAFCLLTALMAAVDDPLQTSSNSEKTHEVLRMRKLEVLNKEGQVIFSISSDAINSGVLALNHNNGNPLLECRTGDFGQAALAILGQNGDPAVCLSQHVSKNQPAIKAGGLIQVFSDRKEPVVWLTSNEKGEGQITLASQGGKEIRKIGLKP